MNIAHGLQFLLFVSLALGFTFGILFIISLAHDSPKIGVPLLLLAFGVIVFLLGASV